MHNFISRVISFILASALSVLVLLVPQALTHDDRTVNHPLLMLLMLGIMVGYIHGVGFRPQSTLIRYALSPLAAWPILMGGILYIFMA